LDHPRDLDSGEMQLEHAGILDLGRLKYISIKLVVKCKLAQGVLYGIRLCGLPMRAVRFVSFVGKILLTVLLPDKERSVKSN
jgi:hypothetical protein